MTFSLTLDALIRRAGPAFGLSEKTATMIASFTMTIGVSTFIFVAFYPFALFVEQMRRSIATVPADLDALWLQPLWTALTSGWLAPYTASPTFPGVLGIGAYFLLCIPCATLDVLDIGWVNRNFKIQSDKPGGWARTGSWTQTLWLTAEHHLFIIFPGLAVQLLIGGPWLYRGPLCLFACDGLDFLPKAAPGLVEVFAHVVLCLIVFDAGYHFWHKWHHTTPLLYKHIHSVHHQYFAPFVWVTQYEHALELLVVSVMSMLVPISLGCHPLTQWIFMVISIQVSIDAHSGYDMGVLSKFLPFWGGNMHHDNHHKYPRTNFQPFFTWFDWAYGTHCDISLADGEMKGKVKG
jgi:cholesterol 25-hydroxylase